MDDLIFKILWCVLVFGSLGWIIYAFVTKGYKGAMFGYKIERTADHAIQYRHKGMKYTFRLHKLGKDDLYGIEVGQWGAIGGSTTPYVIPAGELRLLGNYITQFLDDEDSNMDKLAEDNS